MTVELSAYGMSAVFRRSRPLPGHQGNVYSVVFSPDGQTLASGDSDGQVFLWDTVSWEQKASIAHTTDVQHIAFSPRW